MQYVEPFVLYVSVFMHRHSQNFVWGALFLTKVDDLFLLIAFNKWCTFFLIKLTTFLVVAVKRRKRWSTTTNSSSKSS